MMNRLLPELKSQVREKYQKSKKQIKRFQIQLHQLSQNLHEFLSSWLMARLLSVERF